MRIYADTSFLISLLYRGDTGHSAARAFFVSQAGADWITSTWTQFETVNGLRQLCLARPGPDESAMEGLQRLFKHWHQRGSFLLDDAQLDEAVIEALQMSAAEGRRQRMRSADVLHVALLELIPHDLFVTRDKDQHNLAASRAFNSRLVP